jgi:hypothetical protein
MSLLTPAAFFFVAFLRLGLRFVLARFVARFFVARFVAFFLAMAAPFDAP